MARKRRKFNKEMFNYLLDHGSERTLKEWHVFINEFFGEGFSLKETQHYFVRHALPYKYENINKSNHALAYPIGSERVKADGMVQVKVGPHKWEYKQRYIYEQYYNVELPDNVYVIFLDQNRRNFNIDNLKAVTRYEAATMKGLSLFSHEKEVTETGLMVAQLRIKEKDLQENDKKSRETEEDYK